MQNTSPKVLGRRALIKGAAMVTMAATVRAQSQAPPAEPVRRLADAPLGSSVTITVERALYRTEDFVEGGSRRPTTSVQGKVMTTIRKTAAEAASVLALVASVTTLLAQSTPGVISGPVGPSPYDIVPGWHKPFSEPGFTFGGNSGVFAESPNRIFIAQQRYVEAEIHRDLGNMAKALAMSW